MTGVPRGSPQYLAWLWRGPRYQGRRPSMAARMASAARMRSCGMDTEVDLPDSEVPVEVVSTSWSPIRRGSLSAKSGSSIPEPMTLMVEADHMASMPESPPHFLALPVALQVT